MSAIAGRLGLALSFNSASGKLLSVGVVAGTRTPTKNIHSKTSGNLEPRPKPWNYEKFGYGWCQHLIDGTTKRFDDNSKILVVEGPPALGKSEFAKNLADELDMLYMPPSCMDDIYISPYGFDFRELDPELTYIRNRTYCEKKFAQDPTGQMGGIDRMQYALYQLRYLKYVDALIHLFNTGQGVVMEKSPYSSYCYEEAAYKQGWTAKESRIMAKKTRANTLDELMKPHLVIYLDAPTDVVQAKIRERANTTHPWEKKSPVYENTSYMNHLADLFKKDYLKHASVNSQVLIYDWSEGGDTEVVVEDIERLNLDYFDKYDKQMEDWRLHREEAYCAMRAYYTQRSRVLNFFNVDYFSCDRILLTSDELVEMNDVYMMAPGNRYTKGHNEDMGDKGLFWDLGHRTLRRNHYGESSVFRSEYIDSSATEHKERVKESKRRAGVKEWWK